MVRLTYHRQGLTACPLQIEERPQAFLHCMVNRGAAHVAQTTAFENKSVSVQRALLMAQCQMTGLSRLCTTPRQAPCHRHGRS